MEPLASFLNDMLREPSEAACQQEQLHGEGERERQRETEREGERERERGRREREGERERARERESERESESERERARAREREASATPSTRSSTHQSHRDHCRAIKAHTRQSGPDSGLGFQDKVLEPFKLFSLQGCREAAFERRGHTLVFQRSFT